MASTLEQQNDSRLNDLHNKVSALRNVTIDIHNSASDHSVLDRSLDTVSSFGTTLKTSGHRLNRMINNTGRPGTIKLTAAVMAVLILLYILWR